MRNSIIFLMFVMVFSTITKADDLAEVYKTRYGLTDPYKKFVDGKGRGDERLYGTRNFRVVLNGALYRGGGNNSYHRTNKRDNRNPLQDDALENLCKEGFSSAIYLYSNGFDTADKEKRCDSFRQQPHDFSYYSYDSFSEKPRFEILNTIHKAIVSKSEAGPVYVHCWNGWHASGFVAAIALMQFCDTTADKAVAYWTKTLDGSPTNYQHVVKAIQAFSPYGSLKVSADIQARICPDLDTPRK
jgi:hypothetical protein